MIQSDPPRKISDRIVACLSTAMFVFLGWVALDKPYHIDDTLFERSARALRATGDPLAFDVNWTGRRASGAVVMLNPPVMSALVLGCDELFGPSEFATRMAAIIALSLLALAVSRLAGELGVSRGWTLALALASPAVAVSSGSIMADTLCAALLTLGVAEWMRFTRSGGGVSAASAVLALSGAALTKHAGLIAIIPCFVWTMHARPQRKAVYLLLALPALVLGAYTLWLICKYGVSTVAPAQGVPHVSGTTLVVACAFLGGTSISGVMFAATARGRDMRTVIVCFALALPLALITLRAMEVGAAYPLLAESDGCIPGLVKLEFIGFVTAGTWLGALAVTRFSDVRRPVRDMLGVWIASGLVYAVVVNWDVSMRALLPMIAPLCVIGANAATAAKSRFARTTHVALLALSMGVSALLAIGDREFAGAARADARAAEIDRPGSYFLGHWGFQHYAEAQGGIALDTAEAKPPRGSRVVVPMSNSIGEGIPGAWVASASKSSRSLSTPLLTLGPKSGAGFYAARFGPLPFAFQRGDTLDTWTLILR